MMRLHIRIVLLALLIGCGCLADAEESLHIEFRDGRVWLAAREVTIGAILQQWARVGGVTIVNSDAIEGEPITLALDGIPEREALEIVLRGVPGYLLGPHRTGANGRSVIGRVFILPAATKFSREPTAPTSTTSRPAPSRDPSEFPGALGAILQTGLTGFTPPTPDTGNAAAAPPRSATDPLAAILRSGLSGPKRDGEGQPAEADAQAPGADVSSARR
jgi:hypothetical protein